jgi:maleate isomerase
MTTPAGWAAIRWSIESMEGATAPGHGIGVVAPFDLALDRELYRWAPETVSLYFTRTHALELPMGLGAAEKMSDEVAVRQAARDLMAVESQAIGYACTSGSFVRGLSGELSLRAAMRSAGAPHVVTASGAMLAALRHLGAGRISVATPYVEGITARLCDFLDEAGHKVVGSAGLGLTGGIWKVRYTQVADLVLAADRPDAEAVFVSCTNLPTYDVIAPLETWLGKPVLSANQVMMWALMRSIGLAALGPGRLLQEP